MNIRITLWLLAFSHPLWAAAPKPVTLVVDEVPVVQVLQALVAQENRNLVVSPDVSGTLSLNLTRVPWRQALQTVVTSAGLVLHEEGGFFMFTPQPGSVNSWNAKSRSGHADSLMRRWSRTAYLFLTLTPGNCKKRRKNCSVQKGVCLSTSVPTVC